MKEAVDYDTITTDAWREDAKGLLVFVSPTYPTGPVWPPC